MRTLVSALVFIASVTGTLSAQDIPSVVQQAIDVRLPLTCPSHKDPVRRDSLRYFPGLQVYVGHCVTYFDMPVFVAVATDSTGLLYLLDSPANLYLLEARLGRPQLDSTNLVSYGFDAARIAGVIPWDAQLQRDTILDPDPRERASLYFIKGHCSGAHRPWVHRFGRQWQARFAAATAWWFGTVEAYMVGPRLFFVTTVKCQAMHNP
jgi:hypothetical protein